MTLVLNGQNLKIEDVVNVARNGKHVELDIDAVKRINSCRAMLEKKIENGEGYRFKVQPCPFLKENSCTCYTFRPSDCRSYPHLHKNDFTSRLMDVIENSSLCPIVYNMYESLKEELWGYKRRQNGC